jgi:hypothetical protein
LEMGGEEDDTGFKDSEAKKAAQIANLNPKT